jgi:hypothetical protein
MKCIFDSCEMWNGLLLGFVASALFAIFLYLFNEYLYYKPKYGKIAGKYTGYRYKDNNAPNELDETPISNAVIKHLGKNRLKIVVNHNHVSWSGEIILDSTRFGSIAWQYDNPADKHRYGFKKCIAEKDLNTLYVIGDKNEGYNKEVFKRDIL